MQRVLLTGATGFIGRMLSRVLTQAGFTVRAALRTQAATPDAPESVVVGNIGTDTRWDAALEDTGTVVHLAARVHSAERSQAHASAAMETNAHGTATLVRAAVRAGIRQFLYLSSIKVNGEETRGKAFTSSDEPRPQDPYGMSKWLAEQSIAELTAGSRLETIIVRPPLVYGPEVRANFGRLLRWVDGARPLPLGAVKNERSLVSIWNLTDLIVHALRCPSAANRTWMVSDGEDISTPDLIRRLARAMSRRVRLINVPVAVLRGGGYLLGRSDEIRRLCGSLKVDISDTQRALGWSPRMSVDAALEQTAQWYLAQRSR